MSSKRRHERNGGIAGAIIDMCLFTAILFSIPAGSAHAAQTCYDGGLIIAHADPEYSEGGGTWSVGKDDWSQKGLDFGSYRSTSAVGAWANTTTLQVRPLTDA